MRATPAVVVMAMVVSACVASVEGGSSEPSVSVAAVTTAGVTTTTQPVTTTEAEGPCPEAARGFACPPDLPVSGREVGAPLAGAPLREFNPVTLAPGTYRTRLFSVPFEFTITQPSRSFGEDEDGQIVDLGGTGGFFGVFVMERALRDPTTSSECKDGLHQVDVTFFGMDLVMEVFTVGDDCEVAIHTSAGTTLTLLVTGQTGGFIDFAVAGHELTVLVAPPSDFDTYLAEVAQPILDSIRFLDQ